ncbi:unnamed protein product [Brassica oleracea var. botrytis]
MFMKKESKVHLLCFLSTKIKFQIVLSLSGLYNVFFLSMQTFIDL